MKISDKVAALDTYEHKTKGEILKITTIKNSVKRNFNQIEICVEVAPLIFLV